MHSTAKIPKDVQVIFEEAKNHNSQGLAKKVLSLKKKSVKWFKLIAVVLLYGGLFMLVNKAGIPKNVADGLEYVQREGAHIGSEMYMKIEDALDTSEPTHPYSNTVTHSHSNVNKILNKKMNSHDSSIERQIASQMDATKAHILLEYKTGKMTKSRAVQSFFEAVYAYQFLGSFGPKHTLSRSFDSIAHDFEYQMEMIDLMKTADANKHAKRRTRKYKKETKGRFDLDLKPIRVV